jgi:uncharacterized membrane protein YdbT with pleckstrin-like domain
MPYPKKLLNDRETLVLDLHPHWWYFVEAALALVASIVLGILALAGDWATAVKWITVALIVASAVWLAARYTKWITTNFVVTSDRVIFRHGLFAKSGIEIPLERINSVHFHQTIIERMLGAGDLMIESGSEQGQQRFSDVRNPDRVTKVIHEQMDLNEDRMYGGPRSGMAQPSTDVATQLEKLEGMRDRGTLSPEEFDAQKRKLLGS